MSIEKIRNHFNVHKVKYACIVGGVISAGITYTIMKGRYVMVSNAALTGTQHIGRGIPVAANRGISVIAERSVVSNNVFSISSRRKGSPSWVIRCLETGSIYTSQRKAAIAMEITEAELSKHLNGVMDNVRGHTFERICIAA